MTDVLVVAEHREGAMRDVTAEAVTAATELAEGEVHLALIAEEPGDLTDAVALEPVDTVHTYAHPGEFNHDVYVQVLAHLARELEPTIVLGPNTVNGLDYLPALASSLDWPLVTDAVELTRSSDEIRVTREGFGSKVELTVAVADPPCVLSIRPGDWPATTAAGDPTVTETTVAMDAQALRTEVLGLEAVAGGEVDITEADVLVSVGRGIGEEGNLELVRELADALDATIAASRPIVDAGWLPKDRQVGQSGKTVAPDVYLAIGISGAVQHVAGIKGADTIVAINTDPDAPIFDLADVGIVDDLFDVVPELIAAFTDTDD